MSLLIAGYISLVKLKEIVATLETKEGKAGKGFNFTMSVGDESNEFGQNVAMFAEQNKEQRDAKTPRYYCGNGKVFWTDGKVTLGTKVEASKTPPPSNEDLNNPALVDDFPF